MWSPRAVKDMSGHQLIIYSELSDNTVRELRGEKEKSEPTILLQKLCADVNNVEMINRSLLSVTLSRFLSYTHTPSLYIVSLSFSHTD